VNRPQPGVPCPSGARRFARAANDELPAPLTEDERARLMDLVRRVAGTEAEG
jgi:hypothetical protein